MKKTRLNENFQLGLPTSDSRLFSSVNLESRNDGVHVTGLGEVRCVSRSKWGVVTTSQSRGLSLGSKEEKNRTERTGTLQDSLMCFKIGSNSPSGAQKEPLCSCGFNKQDRPKSAKSQTLDQFQDPCSLTVGRGS